MKRKLKIFVMFFAIASALFYVIFYSEDSLFHLLELKQNEKNLQQDIIQITQETNRLMEEIKNIKDDSFFIEKIARDELGLIKDGEIIILFQ